MRLLSLLALVSIPALAITGSGVKITETRKISDFTEIEVSDGVRLEATRGPTSLTISGDDNVVPLYATEVVDGRLKIRRTTREWIRSNQTVVVKVSTPSLKRLTASGGVEASLASVTGRDFAAVLSGGVHLDAKGLELDTLSLEASGGVNVTADGRAKSAKVNASGGVEVKAKRLELASVTIDASGGCDLELTAKESITGDISGGVGVTVFGNPQKSRVKTSGGAGVEYAD